VNVHLVEQDDTGFGAWSFDSIWSTDDKAGARVDEISDGWPESKRNHLLRVTTIEVDS
jgi:hypothetical protein